MFDIPKVKTTFALQISVLDQSQNRGHKYLFYTLLMIMMINIGEKLREYRVRKGLTQANVAEILSMSISNYAHIEQGKTQVTLEKIQEIAAKLETDIFELLTLGDKNNYYIHNDKQKVSGGYGFIVNNNLPLEYQNLQHENAVLKQENGHLQEKISFLEDKIKNLEKIIDLKSN